MDASSVNMSDTKTLPARYTRGTARTKRMLVQPQAQKVRYRSAIVLDRRVDYMSISLGACDNDAVNYLLISMKHRECSICILPLIAVSAR